MRENTLKKIWARGGVVVSGWLSIPSAFSAEVMAHQGFDSLVIDMQHGVVDYQAAAGMLAAISTTPVIPLARVPWLDQMSWRMGTWRESSCGSAPRSAWALRHCSLPLSPRQRMPGGRITGRGH